MNPKSRPEDVFEDYASYPPLDRLERLCRRHEAVQRLQPAGERFPHESSVIILTLNEELNLPRALASVCGSGDIVVLDAGSVDSTTDIAIENGARVFRHDFVTSSAQRQWALDNIDFKYEFVFVLDADEWVTVALATEVARVLDDPAPGLAAAWVRSRYVYEGRWIPRSSLYPSWTVRLIRLGNVRYEGRVVNAHPIVAGVEVRLREDLIHEDRKSLTLRVRKLERYARLEALETHKLASAPVAAFRTARSWRQRAKVLHSIMPGRAGLKAIALLLRGGALEGRAGLHFIEESFLQERLTTRYLSELRRQDPPSDE